jgi:hypothetical protein
MPMVNTKNAFDADSRMQEKTSRTVLLGGKTLRPVKVTSKIMKDVILTSPDPLTDDEIKEMTPDERLQQSTKGVDNIFEQLSLLLVDEAGDAPPVEWLAEQLDIDTGGDLLEWVLPSGKEDKGPKGS